MNTLHELFYDEVGASSGAHSSLHADVVWAGKNWKKFVASLRVVKSYLLLQPFGLTNVVAGEYG